MIQAIPPAHLVTPGVQLPPTGISKKEQNESNFRVTEVTSGHINVANSYNTLLPFSPLQKCIKIVKWFNAIQKFVIFKMFLH